MKMKRTVLSLVCLVVTAMSASGQVAVKSNLAMDALAVPNLGLELGLAKRWTLDVPAYYNPWDQVMWRKQDDKLFKLFMVQPEARYWFCDKFNGHFLGIHAMGGVYNTTGIALPFSPFDDLAEYRYKGHFYGGGISYGYQYILSRHWSLEATLGIGYAYVLYKKYPCQNCKPMKEKGNEHYVGPTRAALNLIYVL